MQVVGWGKQSSLQNERIRKQTYYVYASSPYTRVQKLQISVEINSGRIPERVRYPTHQKEEVGFERSYESGRS